MLLVNLLVETIEMTRVSEHARMLVGRGHDRGVRNPFVRRTIPLVRSHRRHVEGVALWLKGEQ